MCFSRLSVFKKINKVIFIVIMVPKVSFSVEHKTVDCSEAYGSQATCEVVTCDERYRGFIGSWKGPFLSYSRGLSEDENIVFRPFNNTVTYSESDCLKNIENNDVFIIGRRVDVYPEFRGLPELIKSGLMITGRKADNTPFLRTIDDDGINNYQLVLKNTPADLSIWKLTIPATDSDPGMRFTTIDGRDWTNDGHHKRNVTVTMSIGPEESPFWEHVIVKGYHTLEK